MQKEKTENVISFKELISEVKGLILYNDDHNSFDYVIETLEEVCDLTSEQAEQCAYIAHYKGKCKIKEGDYIFLKPMKEEINKRGLNSVIQ